jgi:hypothetical protein
MRKRIGWKWRMERKGHFGRSLDRSRNVSQRSWLGDRYEIWRGMVEYMKVGNKERSEERRASKLKRRRR